VQEGALALRDMFASPESARAVQFWTPAPHPAAEGVGAASALAIWSDANAVLWVCPPLAQFSLAVALALQGRAEA
jgi:hypothetical protein